MKKLLTIAALGFAMTGLASANDRIGEFDFSSSVSDGVALERHQAPSPTPEYSGKGVAELSGAEDRIG